jgi:putative addiction module component (TIGR02574 family)
MSRTLDQIKKEISALRPAERFELWRDLSVEFEPSVVKEEYESESSVEAAWDEEIEARVKEIEEGKVKLISGEEFEKHVDALFEKHGLNRSDVP